MERSARFPTIAVVALVALLLSAGWGRCATVSGAGLHFFPLPVREVKEAGEKADLADWKRYLGKKASAGDVRAAVYQASPADLESAKSGAGGGATEPARAAKRVFARKETRDALDLLIVERRVDAFIGNGRAAADGEYAGLVAALKALHKSGRSAFVRGRAGHALVRLAVFVGRHNEATAFYDRYLPPKLDAGRARWRALLRKAEALGRLGVREEANLALVRAVANAPELAFDGAALFDAAEGREWEGILRACQSDPERAAAHALKALSKASGGLDDIRTVYALDPGNAALPEMIALEARRIERTAVDGPEFAEGSPLSDSQAGRDGGKLADFLGQALAKGNIADPGTWRLAFAFASRLNGAAKPLPLEWPGRPEEAGRLKSLAAFLEIATTEKPDDARAMALLRIAGETEERDALTRLALARLSGVYRAGGQPALAGLMKARANSAEKPRGRDAVLSADLPAILAEPDVGPLAQHLLGGSEPVARSMDYWLAVAGGLEFSSGRYAGAERLFSRIGDPAFSYLSSDPFAVCASAGATQSSSPPTDKAALARRMVRLAEASEKGGVAAGRALLSIGAALYNASFYGTSREVGSPEWNAAMIDDARPDDPWFDLTLAVKSLMRAEELLRDSEPELAARCAYLLAKCKADKAAEIKGEPPNPFHKTLVEGEARRLKTIYANTEFVRSTLKACGVPGE